VRRILASLVSLALLGSAVFAGAADAKATKKKPLPRPFYYCPPQTLVLSAMPVELSAVLARLDRTPKFTTKTVNGHDYYLGRAHGRSVVLGLTGIGPVNARHALDAALDAFPCPKHGSTIHEVVFSGVAGGDYIGDVIVPSMWFNASGTQGISVSPQMLDVAQRIAFKVKSKLLRTAPAGDPACGCLTSPDAVTSVPVTHIPVVEVGGYGQTTDPFSGRALPCVPGGGDVFGCAPCAAQTNVQRDGPAFVPGAVPFVDPAFFAGYQSPPANSTYNAEDEESFAVADEAEHRRVGFLAFRAVSDGAGDPLMLPGFPAQFFFYRQLAADNAAIATFSFLETLAIQPHIAVELGDS
jgi:nucleoside phosphorylase